MEPRSFEVQYTRTGQRVIRPTTKKPYPDLDDPERPVQVTVKHTQSVKVHADPTDRNMVTIDKTFWVAAYPPILEHFKMNVQGLGSPSSPPPLERRRRMTS